MSLDDMATEIVAEPFSAHLQDYRSLAKMAECFLGQSDEICKLTAERDALRDALDKAARAIVQAADFIDMDDGTVANNMRRKAVQARAALDKTEEIPDDEL